MDSSRVIRVFNANPYLAEPFYLKTEKAREPQTYLVWISIKKDYLMSKICPKALLFLIYGPLLVQ